MTSQINVRNNYMLASTLILFLRYKLNSNLAWYSIPTATASYSQDSQVRIQDGGRAKT